MNCCADMQEHLGRVCPQHGNDCPDRLVVRGKVFTERWYLQSPNATYRLDFCPWCGIAQVEDEPAPVRGAPVAVVASTLDKARDALFMARSELQWGHTAAVDQHLQRVADALRQLDPYSVESK